MTTVLGKEGDNFYAAFYEPEAKKRKKALDKWVMKATPSIQKAVAEELRSFIEFITQGRWTDEGWKTGEEKLHRIQPDYHLIMDIQLRRLDGRELESYKGELPASALKEQDKQWNKQDEVVDDDDDIDDGNGGDRSPNDDRSDSMNPNNDAYEASMDNRSDQMNPNNDAYWSSRGH